MRRYISIIAGLLIVVLGALVLLIQPPAMPAEEPARPVRVGLINTLFRDLPEPAMQVMMRPFKSLLETQTGLSGELVAGGDAATLGQKLKEHRVQFGIFHGFEFAWARLKNPDLKPLVVAVNYRPVLRAKLMVPAASKTAAVADLQGKTVALPRQSREHCHLFFERRCVKPGSRPEQFFGHIANPDDLEEALDDVVDGKYAAVIVDELAFEAYQKMKPGRAARLKPLLRSEPFPCAVVAYQSGAVKEELLDRFREGMIAAKSSRQGQQLMQMCRITGFENPPANFEELLIAIAKAYPPPAK